MTRYGKRFWVLATGLAGLAGYLDAIGYLMLHGLYVSFMSGNSTQMAVGAIAHRPVALMAARLLVAFVLGVFVGTLLAAASGVWRKPVVLAAVGALLAIAAAVDSHLSVGWTTSAMATAMGAANTVFQRDGEVSIGVTYMTGSLVKLGQRLAGATMGGPRWAWVPYLALWAGLVGGAVAGAAVYPWLGASSIWIAVTGVGLLAVYSGVLGPAQST